MMATCSALPRRRGPYMKYLQDNTVPVPKTTLWRMRNQQTFPKDLCCGQPCDIDSDSLSSSVEEHPDLSPKEMLTDDECSDCLVNDADGEEIISDVEITSNSEPDFDEDEREFD